MPTVAELTDELRRLGGSGYSGKKKAELEVMLADLKKFLAAKKASAPAAEAPKPKAAEAAPAPLSAHAESMAKKAKPAKTGAISTPLSVLSAGPAKKSLAEEKAELEAKIKKYEDKKKSVEKRLREIEAIIHAEEMEKSRIIRKKRHDEEAAEKALIVDRRLNPIIERLNAFPLNTYAEDIVTDIYKIYHDAASLGHSGLDSKSYAGVYSAFLGRPRDKSESEMEEFGDAWSRATGKLDRRTGLSKSKQGELVKLLKRWRAVLIEPYGGD